MLGERRTIVILRYRSVAVTAAAREEIRRVFSLASRLRLGTFSERIVML
jgi:hypothetical protein